MQVSHGWGRAAQTQGQRMYRQQKRQCRASRLISIACSKSCTAISHRIQPAREPTAPSSPFRPSPAQACVLQATAYMAVACAVAVRPLVQVAVASAVSTAAPASSKPAVKLAASAVSAVALTTVSVSAGLLATTAVEDPRFHAADCQSRSADASASCEDLQPSTSTCTSAVADANRPTRRVRRSGSKAQRRGSTTLTASVPSMAAAVVLPPKIALRRRHRLRLRAGHSATAAATDKTPREQPDVSGLVCKRFNAHVGNGARSQSHNN